MTIFDIIIWFFVILIIFYIVFRLYKYYKTNRAIEYDIQQLIPNQQMGTQYNVIDKSKIPVSAQGNEYSISYWMFIRDYNYRYGSNKTVLFRADKDNIESNPSIFLQPTSNDLTIKVQLQSNTVNNNNKNLQNPALDTDPNVENFRVSLPIQYFNRKSFNSSNVSGNTVNNNNDNNNYNLNSNEAEYFEDTTITTASPSLLTPSAQPVGDVNSRLDKMEVQIQKLVSSQPTASSDNTQAMGDETTANMPIMYDECTVQNIPIQKWTHVVVSVFNNNIEVYIDGRLKKSCALRGFPKPNLYNMHVCANGGFDGFISDIEYSNMTMPSDDIYNKYKMGPQLNPGFLGSIKNGFKKFISIFQS